MTITNNIKGLIFDYGGTLDSNAYHWSHVLWNGYTTAHIPINEHQFREAYVFGERTLAKSEIIKPDDNFYDLLAKKVAIETQYITSQGFWNPSDTELKERQKTVVAYSYSIARNCTQNARKIIEKLIPHYKLALVSNFYGNINAVLRDFELDKIFPIIIESAVVGVRKPDPAIFQFGIDALQLPAEQVITVGDSFDKDIAPAKKVGCKTIWLKGTAWEEKDVDMSLPNEIITSLDQLSYAIHQIEEKVQKSSH
ncbi:MAG: HAD family hydrolase [Bacteroidaceae bacterium]